MAVFILNIDPFLVERFGAFPSALCCGCGLGQNNVGRLSWHEAGSFVCGTEDVGSQSMGQIDPTLMSRVINLGTWVSTYSNFQWHCFALETCLSVFPAELGIVFFQSPRQSESLGQLVTSDVLPSKSEICEPRSFLATPIKIAVCVSHEPLHAGVVE